MITPCVLWELTKGYTTYLHKNIDGKVFSKDPYNLTNNNTFSDSGICQTKAIGLSVEAEKVKKGYKPIYKMAIKKNKKYVSAKNIKDRNKISNTQFFTKTVKAGVLAVSKCLKGIIHFRPELRQKYLNRLIALHASFSRHPKLVAKEEGKDKKSKAKSK